MYESFRTSPPEGVRYCPEVVNIDAYEYRLYNEKNSMLRTVVDKSLSLLHTPRFVPILGRYALVHSGRGFAVIGPNNYVLDFEHVSSLVGMHHHRLESKSVRSLIAKMIESSKCCRLLPHSRAAMKSLTTRFTSPVIRDKTVILYPTIDTRGLQIPNRNHSIPVVLFMGEYYWKGGREFLEACIRLQSKCDFRVIYISLRVHPPQRVLAQAMERLDMQYHQGPLPRDYLLGSIYPMIDVFAMPSYIDTFGFAFLEAMAHGIPCVGTNHFAIPEIIENERSGIIVKSPISYFDNLGYGHPEIDIRNVDCSSVVDGLEAALLSLLDSESLRHAMGQYASQTVVSGKFSISERNRILSDIYESSMKR